MGSGRTGEARPRKRAKSNWAGTRCVWAAMCAERLGDTGGGGGGGRRGTAVAVAPPECTGCDCGHKLGVKIPGEAPGAAAPPFPLPRRRPRPVHASASTVRRERTTSAERERAVPREAAAATARRSGKQHASSTRPTAEINRFARTQGHPRHPSPGDPGPAEWVRVHLGLVTAYWRYVWA